jgi:glycosyltransferase involved in cell wall biosynthesis
VKAGKDNRHTRQSNPDRGAIHFTGFVPGGELEVPEHGRSFVTASVTEVHPLTVIEAMASGLPVAGIDSPGVGDSVEDGYSGFISDEDLATFTAKMIRLTSDRELRLTMGKQARQAAQRYDIRRTVNLTLEQYERLSTEVKKRRQSVQSNTGRIFERRG